MADTLESTVAARVTALFTNTLAADGQSVSSTVRAALNMEPIFRFSDGTTENHADKIIKIPGRTVASGGSENIDMYDLAAFDVGSGPGRDNLGQTVALAEVCALVIYNRSSSTGSITIGGEGSGAAWNSPFGGSDTATNGPIPPDGLWMIVTRDDPAFAVADSTNHLLKIAASGGSVSYDAVIIGRSA